MVLSAAEPQAAFDPDKGPHSRGRGVRYRTGRHIRCRTADRQQLLVRLLEQLSLWRHPRRTSPRLRRHRSRTFGQTGRLGCRDFSQGRDSERAVWESFRRAKSLLRGRAAGSSAFLSLVISPTPGRSLISVLIFFGGATERPFVGVGLVFGGAPTRRPFRGAAQKRTFFGPGFGPGFGPSGVGCRR